MHNRRGTANAGALREVKHGITTTPRRALLRGSVEYLLMLQVIDTCFNASDFRGVRLHVNGTLHGV
jgi:hypothetical protein